MLIHCLLLWAEGKTNSVCRVMIHATSHLLPWFRGKCIQCSDKARHEYYYVLSSHEYSLSSTPCTHSLVPRPSHRPVFWSLAVCKNGGRRPGIIYYVNDISVYLGRQRWGGVTDLKDTFRARFFRFEPRAVLFSLCEHSKLQRLEQNWRSGL